VTPKVKAGRVKWGDSEKQVEGGGEKNASVACAGRRSKDEKELKARGPQERKKKRLTSKKTKG